MMMTTTAVTSIAMSIITMEITTTTIRRGIAITGKRSGMPTVTTVTTNIIGITGVIATTMGGIVTTVMAGMGTPTSASTRR